MAPRTIWFITGVSSGFGLELAIYALRAGHMVYGTVRSRERASNAVSKIETAGGRCVVLDVTVFESIPAVIQGVLDKEGKIDILVNNAGWAAMGVFEDTT
jgi:NAD(P)-dependent dehydrogenase (short-subunit alcohol dehydrogenase family)